MSSGRSRPGRVLSPIASQRVRPRTLILTPRRFPMRWTKPEAEIVAVTMEVTAYVATL